MSMAKAQQHQNVGIDCLQSKRPFATVSSRRIGFFSVKGVIGPVPSNIEQSFPLRYR